MSLQHPDDPHFRHRAKLPRFLVISPPKTGSTWLADNLRHHPQLFVPAIKEVKYFSSLYKWLDLGWYADHFLPAGERIAGEASPSYAILPIEQIQGIRRFLPDLKLIYLMRDPVSRAWSHAKHAHRYREANFDESRTDYKEVTESEWEANFFCDWTLWNGDYLGQLERWSSVFPREQMYVGFYESIAARPIELLKEIFAFLGADPDVDLASFPISERIFQGPPGELTPRLETTLRRLLYSRTLASVGFIRERFGLVPPAEWQRTLTPPDEPILDPLPKSFCPNAKNAHLRQLQAQEERFHSSYRPIYLGYRGYDIVYYRGQLLAMPQAIGTDHLQASGGAALPQLISEGTCLIAPTLEELKEQLTNRVVDGHEARLRATTAELLAAQAELGNHRAEIGNLRAELGNLQAELRTNRDQTGHKLTELSAAVAELKRPSRVRLLARRFKRVGRRLVTRLSPTPPLIRP